MTAAAIDLGELALEQGFQRDMRASRWTEYTTAAARAQIRRESARMERRADREGWRLPGGLECSARLP